MKSFLKYFGFGRTAPKFQPAPYPAESAKHPMAPGAEPFSIAPKRPRGDKYEAPNPWPPPPDLRPVEVTAPRPECPSTRCEVQMPPVVDPNSPLAQLRREVLASLKSGEWDSDGGYCYHRKNRVLKIEFQNGRAFFDGVDVGHECYEVAKQMSDKGAARYEQFRINWALEKLRAKK